MLAKREIFLLKPHIEYRGESSLFQYVRTRAYEAAGICIDLGEDVNQVRICDGYTPLAIAVAMNSCTMVQILIEKGANVHTVAKSGLTPLQFALRIADTNPQLIDNLLNSGAIASKGEFEYYNRLNIGRGFTKGDVFNIAKIFPKATPSDGCIVTNLGKDVTIIPAVTSSKGDVETDSESDEVATGGSDRRPKNTFYVATPESFNDFLQLLSFTEEKQELGESDLVGNYLAENII